MAQNLAAVFTLTDHYTAVMKNIISSTDSAEKKVNNMAKATKLLEEEMKSAGRFGQTAAGGIGGLTSKITGLVSVAYLGKKALEGMFSAINLSAARDVQEKTYQGLLNSEKIGAQFAEFARLHGKNSLLGQAGAGSAFTSFLPMTRDLEQLKQLERLTQRLYAKDPSQGQSGAVFAMKELLAGDTMSVKERYNMIGFDPQKIRDLSNTGDIAGLIEYVDQMFNRFGATQNVVDKMADTMPVQMNILKDSIKSAFADTATPVMTNLSQVVKQLNADMEAGKFQPFINVMVNGMRMIGNGMAWVAENANWLVPTLGGLMTALIIYKGVMKTVDAVQKIVGISASVVTQNWIQAGVALAAFIGGAAAIGAMSKDIEGQTATELASLDDLANNMANTPLPTEITNTDPVKVSGEVDIEQESLKYMMDFAGKKFLAMYSTATLAPQVNMNNVQVNDPMDLDTVSGYLAGQLADMTNAQPQGVYA